MLFRILAQNLLQLLQRLLRLAGQIERPRQADTRLVVLRRDLQTLPESRCRVGKPLFVARLQSLSKITPRPLVDTEQLVDHRISRHRQLLAAPGHMLLRPLKIALGAPSPCQRVVRLIRCRIDTQYLLQFIDGLIVTALQQIDLGKMIERPRPQARVVSSALQCGDRCFDAVQFQPALSQPQSNGPIIRVQPLGLLQKQSRLLMLAGVTGLISGVIDPAETLRSQHHRIAETGLRCGVQAVNLTEGAQSSVTFRQLLTVGRGIR